MPARPDTTKRHRKVAFFYDPPACRQRMRNSLSIEVIFIADNKFRFNYIKI